MRLWLPEAPREMRKRAVEQYVAQYAVDVERLMRRVPAGPQMTQWDGPTNPTITLPTAGGEGCCPPQWSFNITMAGVIDGTAGTQDACVSQFNRTWTLCWKCPPLSSQSGCVWAQALELAPCDAGTIWDVWSVQMFQNTVTCNIFFRRAGNTSAIGTTAASYSTFTGGNPWPAPDCTNFTVSGLNVNSGTGWPASITVSKV